jgi:hypothetical protein
MTTTITLYHDVYETENGDGFFPHLNKELAFKEINVTFMKENNIWKQIYETDVSNIKGFDGDEGEKILKELNEINKSYNSIEGIAIWNRFNQIYPKNNLNVKLSKKIN